MTGAAASLASYAPPPKPVLLLGAHAGAGGAQLLGKLMHEACNRWLTPVLGLRCQVKDGFEACDPEDADIYVHKQVWLGLG